MHQATGFPCPECGQRERAAVRGYVEGLTPTGVFKDVMLLCLECEHCWDDRIAFVPNDRMPKET